MTRQQAVSAAGFGEALQRLGRAQKPSTGAPLYSRFINRPLGRLLAAVAYVVGLRPNHVTVISAVFTFSALATIALAEPSWRVGLIVMGGLVCGYALDAADGQLARLRGGGSKTGEFLDHVVDCTKTVSLHLVVLIAWYRFMEPTRPLILLIPLIYCVQATVWFFSIILVEQMGRGTESASGATLTPPRRLRMQSLIALPADYGLLIITFVLWGWQSGFVVVYGVLTVANVVLLLAALVRWYRRVGTFDRSTAGKRG